MASSTPVKGPRYMSTDFDVATKDILLTNQYYSITNTFVVWKRGYGLATPYWQCRQLALCGDVCTYRLTTITFSLILCIFNHKLYDYKFVTYLVSKQACKSSNEISTQKRFWNSWSPVKWQDDYVTNFISIAVWLWL